MLVLDADLRVEYGQFYVRSDHEVDPSGEVRDGQVNGLCGAAVPGLLFCTTATSYGRVGLRIEVLAAGPSPGPEHEEVVEVCFHPNSDSTWVQEWDGPTVCSIPLERRWYRLRYSAQQFQAAGEADSDPDRNYPAVIDSYLLQFWPEPGPRPDEVVRQSSTLAGYWHDVARRPRRDGSAVPTGAAGADRRPLAASGPAPPTARPAPQQELDE